MITRRSILLSGAALGGLAAFSLTTGLGDWVYAQISEDFSPDIAKAAQREGFITDYLHFLKKTKSRDYSLATVYFRIKPQPITLVPKPEQDIKRHMTGVLLRSTNVIRVLEVGEDFFYAGIFVPEENACANQLSSHYL